MNDIVVQSRGPDMGGEIVEGSRGPDMGADPVVESSSLTYEEIIDSFVVMLASDIAQTFDYKNVRNTYEYRQAFLRARRTGGVFIHELMPGSVNAVRNGTIAGAAYMLCVSVLFNGMEFHAGKQTFKQAATNVAIDSALSLAAIYSAMKSGAVIGTYFGPGWGSLGGAVIGGIVYAGGQALAD